MILRQLVLCALFSQQGFVPTLSTIIGSDPWYGSTDHYWSFNKMSISKHVNDITGYKKARVYGGADIVPGASKNALQLDGLISTGVNLGNFSNTCLSEPFNCKTGFTILLWIKINTSRPAGDNSYQVIFQVSRILKSVGTTFYAKKNVLGFSVNDKNFTRTIEIAWKRTDWTHLSLIWNKVQDSVHIFLNCAGLEAIRNEKRRNIFYKIPSQNQMWLGSDYQMMKNCKMVIDELAIWYDVLSVKELCYSKSAKEVDGGFTQWSDFSPCTVSCELGTKLRTRTCTNPPPQHGGIDCFGPYNETANCFLRQCPIDGNYTLWSAFTQCSKTCGGGERRRFRTCTNPAPKHHGRNCSHYGDPVEVLSCNTRYCPIDGGLTQWSNFTSCSASCGDGVRTRMRSCSNPPPQHGGKNCSELEATLQKPYCFLKVCPVDGNYGNWSMFTSCSRSCGGGNQTRQRECNNPTPVGDGRNCSYLGPSVETRLCNINECPIHGGYTSWSTFGNCTKTCGGGVNIRTRNCTNPPPAYGGDNCTRLGPPEQMQSCNTNPCPVDGGYSQWSTYTACSKTCGGGTQMRERSCDSPLPALGGNNCSTFGPAIETRMCNTKQCPDIVIITLVQFLEEKFQNILYDGTQEFKNFKSKVEKNVRKVMGPSSAFKDVMYTSCDQLIREEISNRQTGGSQCRLDLRFSSAGYSGIVQLQDALLIRKMLHDMPVETLYITSSDVPRDYKKLNVQAYNSSMQSIMVTWVPSPNRAKENVEGYRVMYIDEMSNRYNTIVQGRDASHVELKNLKIYHFYCIRILPFNSRGDGLSSHPVCTYTDMTTPGGFPRNLTVHSAGKDSLLVTWNPLSKPLHHGKLLRYVIRYYMINTTHNVSNEYQRKDVPPSVNSLVLDDLGRFALYGIQIAAYNERGMGQWSNELLFYTAEAVPGKTPRIKSAYNTSSTSLHASWYPIPKQYHYGQLLGYRVFYKDVTMKNDSHYDNLTIGPDVDDITVTGLRKYRTYVVQVAGFNKKGEGAPSKGILLTTDQDVPSLPPEQVTVANTSSTSLLVQWSPVPENDRNGVILGYKIFYKRSGTNDTVVSKHCIPDTSAADITMLRKYTAYDIQILAYTIKGDGRLSDVVIARTAEDIPSHPPTFLSLYNTSSSSLRVTWLTIPSRYVHGVLLGYRVLYRSINVTREKYVFKEVGPGSLQVILTDLFKYMEYGIRVLGFTKIGLGTVSDEVIVRTDQDVPSWPPEHVTATNKTSPTKIHLGWQPISNPYYIHGILLGYKVIYRAVSNPDEILYEENQQLVLGPNVYNVTIANLTSYTVYSVEVLAFTVKGDGVSSKRIYVETCNCHRSMYSNWWLNPPYTDRNATGIFPSLLKMLTTECCGQCLEHQRSDINFKQSSNQSRAITVDENHVRGHIEEDIEISFPVTGRYNQLAYNDFAFVPLVESGGTVFMTIVDEPGMAARMVVNSVFDLWPMCMAVFVSAFFAGILMWLLDTMFNMQEFPRSPFRGILEGMWWAFITMTTLGYGDRVPKAVHSKMFAIVWITSGLVIVSLFMSFITTSLTTSIMSSEKMIYGSKVAALRNSSEFRLGIRLNAIMDQDSKYDNLRDVYTALKRRRVDGALVDSYSAGSRKDLFGDKELRITKLIRHSSVYGVVLAGNAKRLQSCYRAFLKEERVRVFDVITNNIEPVQVSVTKSEEIAAELFDAGSQVFQQALIWTCVILGVFVVIFVVYEVVTRRKRDPNPVIYDFSDKTKLFPLTYNKDDPFLKYAETKKVMLEVVQEFYANCRETSMKLRAKHTRELIQLHKMKEQAAHPEQKGKDADKKTAFEEVRKALLRIVSGVLPATNTGNAT